jgi:hypothetical protein
LQEELGIAGAVLPPQPLGAMHRRSLVAPGRYLDNELVESYELRNFQGEVGTLQQLLLLLLLLLCCCVGSSTVLECRWGVADCCSTIKLAHNVCFTACVGGSMLSIVMVVWYLAVVH